MWGCTFKKNNRSVAWDWNNGRSPENIQRVRIALERNPHRSLRRQVYLGDGSNALIVMEDISKTLYWRRAFFVNPRHWIT
jgi:5-methylthioribose kinase